MAPRRLNPYRIKVLRSYSVQELADRLGVHKNTVRQWLRNGLRSLDEGRPALFHGATVRDFLKSRNVGRRSPCGPGRFYCFRCREPRPPAGGMVDYLPITARSGNLRALCESCDGLMHRRASLAALARVMPAVAVQIRQAP